MEQKWFFYFFIWEKKKVKFETWASNVPAFQTPNMAWNIVGCINMPDHMRCRQRLRDLKFIIGQTRKLKVCQVVLLAAQCSIAIGPPVISRPAGLLAYAAQLKGPLAPINEFLQTDSSICFSLPQGIFEAFMIPFYRKDFY